MRELSLNEMNTVTGAGITLVDSIAGLAFALCTAQAMNQSKANVFAVGVAGLVSYFFAATTSSVVTPHLDVLTAPYLPETKKTK